MKRKNEHNKNVGFNTRMVLDNFETVIGGNEQVHNETRLEIGMILSRRYKLEKLLGKGGMGEVFLCTDLKLGLQKAIKIIHPVYITNAKIKEKFQNEVKILQRLSHPGIIRIYDFNEDNGFLFYTMEYLEGETLKEKLINIKQNNTPPIPFDKSILILKQILDVLEYAHNKGIVHRDLNPANIMLLPNGQVKLLDFGIAKEMNNAQNTTIAGTPLFIAPEQLLGQKSSVETDIFSLGVTFYFMITGQMNISKPASQLVNVPSSVDRIIWKAIDNDPRKRYHSAKEFKNALDKVLQYYWKHLQQKGRREQLNIHQTQQQRQRELERQQRQQELERQQRQRELERQQKQFSIEKNLSNKNTVVKKEEDSPSGCSWFFSLIFLVGIFFFFRNYFPDSSFLKWGIPIIIIIIVLSFFGSDESKP